jgi:hypothetical protein
VGSVLVAKDFGGFGFRGKMLRVQVVARSGKNIIKGVVEVSEDVSFSSFLLSFFAPQCCVFFSFLFFSSIWESSPESKLWYIDSRIGFFGYPFHRFPE